jgi:hypothetical protein
MSRVYLYGILLWPQAPNVSLPTGFANRRSKAARNENLDRRATRQGNGDKPAERKTYPFRDMDFVKEKVGVEVQFGKYAFMVYNVCAKMTIFRNFGHIETEIETVHIKELVEHMSTGVSYFEQFVWDLEKRGVSNIDVPALILGIGA